MFYSISPFTNLYSFFLISCEKNGFDTETYPDGSKYVGEWKNGEYHGQGTLTLLNGDKYEGKFKDGEKWNGTQYDKDGNITKKYVNGVRQ